MVHKKTNDRRSKTAPAADGLPDSGGAADAGVPAQIELRGIETLVPYARNSNKHGDEQIAEIAASIDEFGLVGGIVVRDGVIAKGHGTLQGCIKLLKAGKSLYPAPGRSAGAKPYPDGQIPIIDASGWTEAQFRAYVITDNQLARKSVTDYEMLAVEIDDLRDLEFDLKLLGFDQAELNELIGTPNSGEGGDGLDPEYTKKITIPVYEPKGDRPPISALTDAEKQKQLVEAIQSSGVSEEEKEFLISAAGRHVVFDYHQIAEYYCHATPEMQALMERSALVLIDFDKAVAEGYVAMTKALEGVYSDTYGDDNDGDEE